MDSATLERVSQALADRYTVEQTIGRGGMATVLRATDRKHGRAVAIKVLDPEIGQSVSPERFEAEIRVTAALQHPHLLPLFDSGEAGARLFYVMPFVEGESLRTRLDRERQLPLADVVRLTTAMAHALDYAHSRGVLHRDLKPENILLQAGQPIIADFGIALATQRAPGARITQTGFSVGTPQYMSPEQASGERDLDARSDQFALAAVVYEMLTGEPPFSGATPAIVMTRLMTERPRPVHVTRPQVPVAVHAAVDKALSFAPADRFTTSGAFAEALAVGSVATTPASVVTAALPARARGIGRWVAIGAATVALAAAAVAWTRRVPTSGAPAAAAARGHVVLTVPTGASGATALAARVDDALAQALGQLPWLQVRTASSALATDDAVLGAARAAGAGYVAITSLLPSADGGGELRMKVMDVARGTLVRQLPSASIASASNPATIAGIVAPLAVVIGFTTNRHLGADVLPRDRMPQLDAFVAFTEALDEFRMASSPLRADPSIVAMRRAVAKDTSFLQAKLWLGALYGWTAYLARRDGGVERADTVLRWAEDGLARGTRHEQVLAELARSQVNELESRALDALRAEVARAPRSPLRRMLVSRLIEINRPYEALRLTRAYITAVQQSGDSVERATLWNEWSSEAELWHYTGHYDSTLATVRRTFGTRSADLALRNTELYALAALGRVEEAERLLAQIESTPSDGSVLGFVGNTYSTLAIEFAAHGYPEPARRVAEQGVRWFEFNREASRDDVAVGLRKALLEEFLGRQAAAESTARRIAVAPGANEVRVTGLLGRFAARAGRTAEVESLTAVLRALPAARLQGAPTYELATIAARQGRAHWDEAVQLLELALRQHAGFGIRRRLHTFDDWRPLKDYPPFTRIITPADSLQ
jgi:tetratricopeptide (TPR) repeat protein